MDRLRIAPTAFAQWQALVKDAEQVYGKLVSEELENYLVLLLDHYANRPEVLRSILALDFLESQNKPRAQQEQELRQVGDKCLLFSGFFPELAERRRVQVSYFVDMGKQAYASLASLEQASLAELFDALQSNFVDLMDILLVMREFAGKECSISPLHAEELWRSTGSQHARAVLRRYTQAMLAQPPDSLH